MFVIPGLFIILGKIVTKFL